MSDPVVLLDEVGRRDVLEEKVEGAPEEDLVYSERYCACGGVMRMHAHRYQLFGPNGFMTNFEQRHYVRKGIHQPVNEAKALEIRRLRAALNG